MPTFAFTSPEGKQYTIDGPEGATREQAWQMLQLRENAPAQQQPSVGDTVKDVVKQGGSGILSGIAHIPTAAAEMADKLGTFVHDKFGIGDPDAEKKRQELKALIASDPNSFKAEQQKFDTSLPAPETPLGSYARAGGQAVGGGALSGAPLRTLIGAGVGSKVAGDAAQGTGWETPAELAGGLIGGGVGHSVPGTAAAAGRGAAITGKALGKATWDTVKDVEKAPFADLIFHELGVGPALGLPPGVLTGGKIGIQTIKNIRAELAARKADAAAPEAAAPGYTAPSSGPWGPFGGPQRPTGPEVGTPFRQPPPAPQPALPPPSGMGPIQAGAPAPQLALPPPAPGPSSPFPGAAPGAPISPQAPPPQGALPPPGGAMPMPQGTQPLMLPKPVSAYTQPFKPAGLLPKPEEHAAQLMAQPEIQAQLKSTPIDATHQVKEGAGINTDGSVSVDRSVPATDTINGKTYSPQEKVKTHEVIEGHLMKQGMSYEDAHKVATAAEKQSVKADGVDWDKYQSKWGNWLHKTENQKITDPAPNLDPAQTAGAEGLDIPEYLRRNADNTLANPNPVAAVKAISKANGKVTTTAPEPREQTYTVNDAAAAPAPVPSAQAKAVLARMSAAQKIADAHNAQLRSARALAKATKPVAADTRAVKQTASAPVAAEAAPAISAQANDLLASVEQAKNNIAQIASPHPNGQPVGLMGNTATGLDPNAAAQHYLQVMQQRGKYIGNTESWLTGVTAKVSKKDALANQLSKITGLDRTGLIDHIRGIPDKATALQFRDQLRAFAPQKGKAIRDTFSDEAINDIYVRKRKR